MIVCEHLTKRYGEHVAVQDVSLRCEPGTVTGFLGPNGAGKSTTMRMLCGLTPPTSGRATVDGVPYAALPQPGRRIGVLLDASAQHAGRTGREVLALSAAVLGLPRRRVDEVLALVGLDGKPAGRRTGDYSLGMRQRLGLAHALLGDPDCLVLDEPANGLDPEGIHWMRGLLRDFADRGGTVLLSSHLLHEVEAVADRLVVIAGGRIVAEGTSDELLAGGGVVVRSPEPTALRRALAAAGLPSTATTDGGHLVDAAPEAVGRAAAAAGVPLVELRVAERAGLEDLFLSLTRGGGADAAPADRTDAPLEIA
ncbi:ABC transporter ATP-binding protein [Patulibacter sp. SYSU D01012]|uniref:ABC transporter ATP-binding protein n=1 Tax=Patulibacter sp. SYSU D01012 TaxID=2817381 RepID=UPI001B30E61A|nr:ABC transporter ATP-binding protein [Patulibacter sp. SYSU D01012]